MEVNFVLSSHLRLHYKKILILCGLGFGCYIMKKYIEKRKEKPKKEKKKIKDFPSIEQIQKFIEDLPFDEMKFNKNITLKDLLGELTEFSEDEDWRELIASVHSMYEQDEVKENITQSGNVFSIYEDPNVISLNDISRDTEYTQENENTISIQNMGDGDVDTTALNNINTDIEYDNSEMQEIIQGNGDHVESTLSTHK